MKKRWLRWSVLLKLYGIIGMRQSQKGRKKRAGRWSIRLCITWRSIRLPRNAWLQKTQWLKLGAYGSLHLGTSSKSMSMALFLHNIKQWVLA